jgi:hypothetical protein
VSRRRSNEPIPGEFFSARLGWYLCVAPIADAGIDGRVVKGCEVTAYATTGRGAKRRVEEIATKPEGEWIPVREVVAVETRKRHLAEVHRKIRLGLMEDEPATLAGGGI